MKKILALTGAVLMLGSSLMADEAAKPAAPASTTPAASAPAKTKPKHAKHTKRMKKAHKPKTEAASTTTTAK